MKISVWTGNREWGGTEVHALALANALTNRGHEVIIIQLRDQVYTRGEPCRFPKVTFACAGLDRRLEDMTFSQWIELLRSFKSEIGIFEKGTTDIGSWRLDFAARVVFGRYITIEQLICDHLPPKTSRKHFGGLVPGIGMWWYQILLKRYVRSIGPHRIVCVSEAVRSRLTQEYWFPEKKTLTIHNGIDTWRFAKKPGVPESQRQCWQIPKRARIFGAVGRLAKIKRYDMALLAFKELRSMVADKDSWLVLAGEGTERQALERQAERLGIKDKVRFLGFTERAEEVLSGIDVFLMPSEAEGLPHALVEAMACQCVPIATKVGGVSEVVIDSSVGWLVEPGDKNAFLSAMKQALELDEEGLRVMGERARQSVLSRFDSRALLQNVISLIEA